MTVDLLFFFFKQKTAYEMRISDWSSDVCSSDLEIIGRDLKPQRPRIGDEGKILLHQIEDRNPRQIDLLLPGQQQQQVQWALPAIQLEIEGLRGVARRGEVEILGVAHAGSRSEEHTSELQSLMRISYAVFCLKKKN